MEGSEGTLKAEDIRRKPSKVGHAFPGRGNVLKQTGKETDLEDQL